LNRVSVENNSAAVDSVVPTTEFAPPLANPSAPTAKVDLTTTNTPLAVAIPNTPADQQSALSQPPPVTSEFVSDVAITKNSEPRTPDSPTPRRPLEKSPTSVVNGPVGLPEAMAAARFSSSLDQLSGTVTIQSGLLSTYTEALDRHITATATATAAMNSLAETIHANSAALVTHTDRLEAAFNTLTCQLAKLSDQIPSDVHVKESFESCKKAMDEFLQFEGGKIQELSSTMSKVVEAVSSNRELNLDLIGINIAKAIAIAVKSGVQSVLQDRSSPPSSEHEKTFESDVKRLAFQLHSLSQQVDESLEQSRLVLLQNVGQLSPIQETSEGKSSQTSPLPCNQNNIDNVNDASGQGAPASSEGTQQMEISQGSSTHTENKKRPLETLEEGDKKESEGPQTRRKRRNTGSSQKPPSKNSKPASNS
jgi:hypothetical protein